MAGKAAGCPEWGVSTGPKVPPPFRRLAAPHFEKGAPGGGREALRGRLTPQIRLTPSVMC
jgi:hypothetical protein